MTMMISKFHKLIQSKIVWGAFAVLISVAFVSVYTPGSRSRSRAKLDQKKARLAGKLFGEEVSRNEFGQAYRNVSVTYTLRAGRPITITEEVDKVFKKMAWQRIAALKKAKKLGMTVTPQQIIEAIQREPLFQNQKTGQFDKQAYNTFIVSFLRPRMGMSEKGLENLFSEQVLIDKISMLPAQGGLVTENEIKKAFHLYTDLLTVEYATLPHSLVTTPTVTEAEAKQYFETNKEQFRIPEKAIVSYVQFAVADYTNTVTVTDDMISSIYENNKQYFMKTPAADAPADAAPEFKPLEEVKGEIVEKLTHQMAKKAASDQADELVSELADETMTFEKATNKLELKVVESTPAFSLTDPVKDVDPTAPFARNALSLTKDATHYYSDPVVGENFVYVISLTKKLDSFLPAFDTVRDAVMESAKIAATERAYAKKAEEIQVEIKTAVEAGTSFTDAIAKYKLELKTTKPFSVTTELEDEFGQNIKAATAWFDQGKVSGLIPTSDEFIVAYIAKKVLGDEATALPGMRDELASSIANDKSSRFVAAWRENLLVEANFEDLMQHANDES